MSQKAKTRTQLNEQAREIIFRLCCYLREQKEKGPLTIIGVTEVASEATGVSTSTVKRIIKEGEKSQLENGFIHFSKVKITRDREQRIIFDDLNRCAVRRKIHELYAVNNVRPLLADLHYILQQENVIDSSVKSKTHMTKNIRTVGFYYGKEEGYHKDILRESPKIVDARREYITAIRAHRKLNKSIVYLDETYLHENRKTTDGWQYDEEIGVLQPIRKGRRLLIAHAGNTIGLLPNNLLVYKSGDDLAVNFVNWLHDVFIPILPKNSVIVMNNVIYHCLQEKKSEQEKEKSKDSKVEILKALTLEDLFTEAGHKILLLPPYHCDLNPLKFVFHEIKEQVKHEIFAASIDSKIQFCETLFTEFRNSFWTNACDQVIKIEDQYMDRDKVMEAAIIKSIESCKTHAAKFMESVSNKMDCDDSFDSEEESDDS